VSAGGARRGRRDNGLSAAAYAAAGDVDPRVGEHLLDVLAASGIAAYLQPASDQNPITRTTTMPARPTDRLFVDRSHLATAREYVARLAAEEEQASRVPDIDAEWARIVAGFDAEVEPGSRPWPAAEHLDPPGRDPAGDPGGDRPARPDRPGGAATGTAGPTAADLTPNDPTTNGPTANDPTAHDPTANDPTAGRPNATDPTANDPTGSRPNATDPIAGAATADPAVTGRDSGAKHDVPGNQPADRAGRTDRADATGRRRSDAADRARDWPVEWRRGADEPSLLDALDTFGTNLPDEPDDEEGYTPPPPPPLPRFSKYAVTAVLAVVCGFVLFLFPDLLPLDPDMVMLVGFTGILAGFVTLVWRLRPGDDEDADDDPENGAVV
jgi:hypothetical protein